MSEKITDLKLAGKSLAGIDPDRGLMPATHSIIDEVKVNLHYDKAGNKVIDAYYYSRGQKIAEQHHLEKEG
jgi:hypothetical protein